MRRCLTWRGIEIEVSHTKNWLNTGFDHIELRAAEPLPITETGYRSHFLDPGDLTDYEDAADFARFWLDITADKNGWDGQLSLL